MKNYNFENIRKGWKTTVLAIVLILGSVASVLLDYSTWSETTPVILIGIALLPYSKEE